MPLAPCRECGQDVSTEAETCPACGVSGPTNLPCPKCGSGNTKRASLWAVALGSFVGGSCMIWIPIVGWILAPILFLVALGVGLAALVPGTRRFYFCGKCRNMWRPDTAQIPGTSTP